MASLRGSRGFLTCKRSRFRLRSDTIARIDSAHNYPNPETRSGFSFLNGAWPRLGSLGEVGGSGTGGSARAIRADFEVVDPVVVVDVTREGQLAVAIGAGAAAPHVALVGRTRAATRHLALRRPA